MNFTKIKVDEHIFGQYVKSGPYRSCQFFKTRPAINDYDQIIKINHLYKIELEPGDLSLIAEELKEEYHKQFISVNSAVPIICKHINSSWAYRENIFLFTNQYLGDYKHKFSEKYKTADYNDYISALKNHGKDIYLVNVDECKKISNLTQRDKNKLEKKKNLEIKKTLINTILKNTINNGILNKYHMHISEFGIFFDSDNGLLSFVKDMLKEYVIKDLETNGIKIKQLNPSIKKAENYHTWIRLEDIEFNLKGIDNEKPES